MSEASANFVGKNKFENPVDAYKAIKKINYSIVDMKYVQSHPRTKDVSKIRNETLKYLAMASVNKKPYSPSKVVDGYWHEAILNTRVYGQISKKLGGTIQHVPADGSEKERTKAVKNFELFKKHYLDVFGSEVDGRVWKVVATSHNCTCSNY